MLSDATAYTANITAAAGLNPCSNGICSLTDVITAGGTAAFAVLILVLMEYAL